MAVVQDNILLTTLKKLTLSVFSKTRCSPLLFVLSDYRTVLVCSPSRLDVWKASFAACR